MIAPNDLDVFQTFADGQLTEDQAQALMDRLKNETELCRAWIRFCQDEAIFQEWAQTQTVSDRVERKAEILSLCGARSQRVCRLGLAAASVLLAVVGIYFGWQWISGFGSVPIAHNVSKEPEQEAKELRISIGSVEDLQGEVFVESDLGKRPMKKGQTLYEGQKLSTRGGNSFAVITLKDSSRLELGRDTIIAMPKERDFSLQQGTLAAEVAPQPEGHPMSFRTPHVSFVSAGSTVSVQTLGEETHIEPEIGSVSMTTTDGTNIEIGAGNVAVVTKNGQSVAPARKKVPHKRNPKKG